MIYLLKTGPYLKIGYSGQMPWERRLHQLRNASPYDIEVLNARVGTEEQEQELHAGAKQWQHRGDWYVDCPEFRTYCDLFFNPDLGVPNAVPSEGRPDNPQSLSVSEQE